MRRMITTRDRIVQEIVERRQKMIDEDRMRKDIIKGNWVALRSMGFGRAEGSLPPAVLDYKEGRMMYDVIKDGAWKGQRCFIIGGGESLKDFDFSKLKNEFVIGINRAYEKIDCNIMFAMDHNLYEWIVKEKLGQQARMKFEDFKGLPVWLDSVGYDYPPGIFILNKNRDGSIMNSSMEDGIGGGSNAGFGALSLAVCLGANPIYLLGYDMKGKGGRQAWWHSGYPDKQSDSVYKEYINEFKRAVPGLKAKGIQVINLNSESELKCFEFGKFDDLKPIKKPIIVSFYTRETEYEEQIEELKITLRRFNLENDIEGIADMGSWHKNTYYKAKFIRKMMKKHPDRSIVFVDADAKIRNNPVLFDDFDCDFACHFHHGRELLSGTLYFGNTKGARYLVDKWVAEDKLHPKTHMPQMNLRTVFHVEKDKISWKELPIEYCMIFDSRMRYNTNPVIEHFQLSRKHKGKKSNPQKWTMKRSLMDIQRFCKGKRMCILGNADSILRSKKNIDSFDAIGRMNRGKPKGKEEFVGSRTDILFLSTSMSRKNIEDAFNPNFVVWMTICNRLAHPWVLRNAIQNPKKDWKDLHKELGTNPTTGMMALKFVLKYLDFKSLTIYGFNFLTTKSWYNTRPDSGEKHCGEKEEILFMKMIKNRKNVRFVK